LLSPALFRATPRKKYRVPGDRSKIRFENDCALFPAPTEELAVTFALVKVEEVEYSNHADVLRPFGLMLAFAMNPVLKTLVGLFVDTDGGSGWVKATVTRLVCVMVTEHVPVPLQSCVQPLKFPVVGVCVRLTLEPDGKSALQVPVDDPAVKVQLIEPGDEVTRPEPLPVPVTCKVWGAPKLALVVRSTDMVRSQADELPLHDPLHAPNVDSEPDDAVKRTVEPSVKSYMHAPNVCP